MAFPERRLRGDRLRRNPQGVFMPRIAKKAISNVASIESGSKARPEAEKISASASQSAATLEERIRARALTVRRLRHDAPRR